MQQLFSVSLFIAVGLGCKPGKQASGDVRTVTTKMENNPEIILPLVVLMSIRENWDDFRPEVQERFANVFQTLEDEISELNDFISEDRIDDEASACVTIDVGELDLASLLRSLEG